MGRSTGFSGCGGQGRGRKDFECPRLRMVVLPLEEKSWGRHSFRETHAQSGSR